MPNSKTFQIKPINELIHKYAYGKIIDPFANSNKLATVTNDLDTQYDTDYHMDALEFLKMSEDDTDDTVFYQVLPYNLQGTIYNHLKFCGEWKTLIKFLKDCKLTEKSANKLKKKLEGGECHSV